MKNFIKKLAFLSLGAASFTQITAQQFLANDSLLRYTGRIDFTDSLAPRYSYPSVSIKAKFKGTGIDAVIHDYSTGGVNHTNYYKVIVDDSIVIAQLKMINGENTYTLDSGLTDTTHTMELIKITEGAAGQSAFKGFNIEGAAPSLLAFDSIPGRKIEFIGDSWTAGYGNLSQFTTGNESMANSGFVAENEDNYFSWGPIAARHFDAAYHVTAISGRGMYRNNSGSESGTIPKNYDYIFEDNYSVTYDHSTFHPDVISIHLGTNDMALEENGSAFQMDDGVFEKTYLDFISKLLTLHPCSKVIICIGNSKSDSWPTWTKQLSRLRTIANNIIDIHNQGNVTLLELPYTAEKWTGNPADDCGYGDAWHPSLCSHEEMSERLIAKIETMNINWGNQSNCPALSDTSLWVNTHNTASARGIENSNKINIRPNPATDYLNIVSPVSTWMISDLSGRVLMTGNESTIDIKTLNAGLYHLSCRYNNSIDSVRFVKQ